MDNEKKIQKNQIIFFITFVLQVLGIIIWNTTDNPAQTLAAFSFPPFGFIILAIPIMFFRSLYLLLSLRAKATGGTSLLDKKLF